MARPTATRPGCGGRGRRIMRGFHHSQETVKSMSLARHELLQEGQRRQVGRLQSAPTPLIGGATCDVVFGAGPPHEQGTRERKLLVDGSAVNALVCAAISEAAQLRDRAVLSQVTSQPAGFARLISPRRAPHAVEFCFTVVGHDEASVWVQKPVPTKQHVDAACGDTSM